MRLLALEPNLTFPIDVIVAWKGSISHGTGPYLPEQLHVELVGRIEGRASRLDRGSSNVSSTCDEGVELPGPFVENLQTKGITT